MIVWGGNAEEHGPAGAPARETGGGPAARSDGPILIVDDDASIVETVRAILEAEGYAVAVAMNGREALELCERITPSLMLLDMRMPVLDGWGVAAALRERGGARFPIVVMTAAENARRWAEEIAADDHLAKPFELGDLLDCVARHGRRGRLH